MLTSSSLSRTCATMILIWCPVPQSLLSNERFITEFLSTKHFSRKTKDSKQTTDAYRLKSNREQQSLKNIAGTPSSTTKSTWRLTETTRTTRGRSEEEKLNTTQSSHEVVPQEQLEVVEADLGNAKVEYFILSFPIFPISIIAATSPESSSCESTGRDWGRPNPRKNNKGIKKYF